ncbi:MAG: DUF2975 domain-containing protein [Lachnospiraceae bacterium]|nr:DUF2975 domain-containing protein [Lachnospiraceae bacterium]
MKQKTLSDLLKVFIVGLGAVLLIVCVWTIPSFGQSVVKTNSEFAYCYYPWLVFLLIAALPCFISLVLAWLIVDGVGKNNSFTLKNASLLKWISILAAGDAAFFFVMNVIYLFMNMNHPGIALMSLIVVFMGVLISIVAAMLSRLVREAAGLKEESDLTI